MLPATEKIKLLGVVKMKVSSCLYLLMSGAGDILSDLYNPPQQNCTVFYR